MKQRGAMIAMSGGVDSSVAAYLMLQAGYRCAGAYIQMCDRALLADAYNEQSVSDAQAVATRMEIPFYCFDGVTAFKDAVVKDFVESYEAGLTPNPCICCNKRMKFSYLLDKALELGFDILVTGHYARIRQDEQTGRYLLYKAADEAKDQTYFLSCLDQRQLSHLQFPLGELTKEQVRALAEEQRFLTARKKDSQDICFIPDGDYAAFIRRYTGKGYPAGDFLDLNGNVIGRHNGAICYTLGQRKGLGLAMGTPVYVCSKDMQKNTVTVGPEETLFATTLLASDWNWLPFEALTEPIRVLAKARYRHISQPATVYPAENGFARVVFDTPQRAITPGQTVAVYWDDLLVGGGIIRSVE